MFNHCVEKLKALTPNVMVWQKPGIITQANLDEAHRLGRQLQLIPWTGSGGKCYIVIKIIIGSKYTFVANDFKVYNETNDCFVFLYFQYLQPLVSVWTPGQCMSRKLPQIQQCYQPHHQYRCRPHICEGSACSTHHQYRCGVKIQGVPCKIHIFTMDRIPLTWIKNRVWKRMSIRINILHSIESATLSKIEGFC